MDETNDLKIDDKSGCLWITLPDSINMDTYTGIESAIAARMPAHEARVVLDLSKTNNLFSSGLGLIIRVRKQAMASKGRIFLVNVSQKIRAILEAVKLHTLFAMYATDVEFEISQGELFKSRILGSPIGFVFVRAMENEICRIHLSGHMTIEQNLTDVEGFVPTPFLTRYVFDLTGLDIVDSAGARILTKLLMNIHRHAGKSLAYGANESIAGLVDILGLNEYLQFVADERSALECIGNVSRP
jgi:anti-anti-sigma factor